MDVRSRATGVSRRDFLTAAGAAASVAGLDASRSQRPDATDRVAVGGRQATRDLARRIALTGRRLTVAGVPAFSDAFILADVRRDPVRRFTNYAGDLSGRYLEALALVPPAGRSSDHLRPLAARLLDEQQPDGRFGRADLRFTRAETGVEHMPLLWGNGRLLVGLMALHGVTGDRSILAAARRLGTFLIGVQATAGSSEVLERVERGGAAGFICFTQLNEGLVLLWQATRDERLLAAARTATDLLQPRGTQHSHGFLTTLRGALMLHEATGDAAPLARVERTMADLLASGDYLADGGTHEFFGWGDPDNQQALEAARTGSGEDGRNEGCSLADLVRLALHLHRVTGNIQYLDAAERCWLNAFTHNQFSTGDFGHRAYFAHGYKPVPNLARAWWCCTMHGHRCFPDVVEAAVAVDGQDVRVDLFEDVRLTGPIALDVEALAFGARVHVEEPLDRRLALRMPTWADAAELRRNGRPVTSPTEGGYLRLAGPFASGDEIEVRFLPRMIVRTPNGRDLPSAALTTAPLRGTLVVGPYVMSVSEEGAPDFFGEPWAGNVVRLDATAASTTLGRWPRLDTTYEHDGFEGRYPLKLRALASPRSLDQQTEAFWLTFARA
jgi:hypothetical protein